MLPVNIGNPELKKLIAARIEKKYGFQLDPNRNIIINPGSDNGLIFAMMPWIEPGDEVMVHDPSYPSNFLNPELLGGVTVRVPTYPEDGYHIRIREYEKRVTSKTKMVLLTNPNNPTGTVYTRKELEELAAFCVEHDLICVCDQAFEDTVFPEHETICICQLPGMWERTVTVCSVSKGMGLSGFRVGWTYDTDTIMDTYYSAAVNIQGATSTLAQLAVMPAFRDDSFIQIGTDADFTICDMEKVWTVDEKFPIYSKPHLDPLWGQALHGKVISTIVRGRVVMEDDKILAEPGYGRFIRG